MSEMAGAARQSQSMSADQAFRRLREDLGGGKLADEKRIRGLTLTGATRAVRGELEVRTIVVERLVGEVEEPLSPGTALPQSIPLDPWVRAWPPARPDDLRSTNIDVRESYSVCDCPECHRSGAVRCGQCSGRGMAGSPPQRCGRCSGTGAIACKRCRQTGVLLRFKRIAQRVSTTKGRLRLPEGTPGVPRGPATGEVEVASSLGFKDANHVHQALTTAAPGMAGIEWLPRVVEELAAPAPGVGINSRLGWRSATGRWYEGWQLQCQTGGKVHEFFVPDSDGTIVGPRLRSPIKLAVAGGVTACILALAIGLITWRVGVAAAAEEDMRRRGAAAEAAAAEKRAQWERERAEAAAQERARAEAEAKTRRLAAAQAAALAFDKDKDAVTKEVSALEALVRRKKWDEAAQVATALESRLQAVMVPESPIGQLPWVLALKARATKQERAMDAEKQRRAEAEAKKQAKIEAENQRREGEEARRRVAAQARAGAIEIDATTLWREYDRNEVAADERYKGKDLIVSGRVDSVDKDFLDNIVVRLRSPNEFMPTSAYVPDSEKAATGRLSKGDRVELRCKCDGRVVGSPVLRNCTIL